MKPIWTVEKLLKLCKRDKPFVREWAFKKLVLLYPNKAADTALKLLKDKEDYISMQATLYFEEYYSKDYEEPLLNIYKELDGMAAYRLSEVLLEQKVPLFLDEFKKKYTEISLYNIEGYANTLEYIAETYREESKDIIKEGLERFINQKIFIDNSGTLFMAGLKSGLNIYYLIDICHRHNKNQSRLNSILLSEITDFCGFKYLTSDIAKKVYPQIISDETMHIRDLGNSTGKKIESLYDKKKYDEIIKLIYEETKKILSNIKIKVGYKNYLHWESGYGRPRQNIEVIKVIYEKLNSINEKEKYKFINCAVAVFALFLEFIPLIGLNTKKMKKSDILETFIQDRGYVEEDYIFEELLKKSKWNEVIISSLLDHLKKHPDSLANVRIFSLLGDIADTYSLKQLLDLDLNNDDYLENIQMIFYDRSIDVFPFISSMIDNNIEKTQIALSTIENLPYNSIIELILNNWDWLLEEHREDLLDAVRSLGDKRFISLLKKAIDSEDFLEGDVFCLLCQINGIKDPLVKKIEKGMKRRQKDSAKALQTIGDKDLEDMVNEPIDIEVKCRTCNRVYSYEISDIMIEPDTEEIFIKDSIICKNCNAYDHYEITEQSIMTIITGMMVIMKINEDAGTEAPTDRTIHFGKFKPIDGKVMSFKEAIEYYKNKIEKDTEDIDALTGYANVLRMSKWAEDAIPVYRKIIELDPMSIDAYVSLGQIAENKGNFNEAYKLLKKTVELFDNGNTRKIKTDMNEFKSEIIINLFELSERLNKPISQELFDKYSREIEFVRGY